MKNQKIKTLIVFSLGVIFCFVFLKFDNPIKNIFFKIKENFFSNFLVSSNLDSFQLNVEKKFISNDFEIILKPSFKTGTIKTAGVIVESDSIKVFEQEDIFKIWEEYNLGEIYDGYEPAVDSNNGFYGGVRKVFVFQDNIFLFLSLKKKDSDCFFASILNLSKKNEIFRAPCVPDFVPPNVDFNAVGGGWVSYNSGILFALGAPSVFGLKTEMLAQDLNSPYGKILFFDKQQLLDGSVDKKKYNIFSLGHRNIQGMVTFENDIFVVEHGPKGGDEINLVRKNNNYGWPIYSLGTDYKNVNRYKPFSSLDQFTNPLFTFIPSAAISDIVLSPSIVSNRYNPLSSFLVSSLRGTSLFIILLDKSDEFRVVSVERIDVGVRLRQFFRVGDKLYVTTDGSGIFEILFRRIV